MSKKLGPLERGIIYPPKFPPGLILRAQAEHQLSEEFDEKVRLLFEKYDVKQGNWKHLAIALATIHEVGFHPVRAPGRPSGSAKTWTIEADDALTAGYGRLKKLNPGLSNKRISELLSQEPALEGRSADAIRRRWLDLRKAAESNSTTRE